MTASALLRELSRAGIRLSRDGERLYAEAAAGTDMAAFRDGISCHKSELLAELLKAEIIAVLETDPAAFDRPGYERLRDQYDALEWSLQ